MTITTKTVNGSKWKGTYSKYTAYFRVYLNYTYDNNYSATQVKFTINAIGIEKTSGTSAVEMVAGVDKWCEIYAHKVVGASSGYDVDAYYDKTSSSIKFTASNPSAKAFATNKTFLLPRNGTNDVTLYFTVDGGKYSGAWHGLSDAEFTITVPKREVRTVTFNNGSHTSGDMPSNISSYYGATVKLPDTIPTTTGGYTFVNWQDQNGKKYNPNASVTLNENLTLTAQWTAVNPPTCENGGIIDDMGYAEIIKGISSISVDVSNVQVNEDDRTIQSIVLSCGTDVSDPIYTDGELTVTPTTSGTLPVVLTITDSADAYSEYILGTIEVAEPKWNRTVVYSKTGGTPFKVPDMDGEYGKITVEAYNYRGADAGDYTPLQGRYKISETDTEWSIDVELDSNLVDDPTSLTPESKIAVIYDHTDVNESQNNLAFFNTSRNANFSNGIYNTMFISGCSDPDYNSRVWWSYANNPLYFPDTNYVEVGSNDTAVMGLTKVSDYLGAVKQSKTTDTAIYLLYPTSFEEDTTYAVRQGVQGIGALSKYSFNILGDETLFLSPNGVMAIEPMQDDDHKVRNRSYFVDGQLLKEGDLKLAYSFVHDGKYYLALSSGRCYVLDGNQRNSWGNDRTNLVYECYCLENVPAQCMMKYNDELWFSNDSEVYRFKSRTAQNAFIDGYNMKTGEENVPVKAEWSTILDDDGALHYYKTMQKKGNVVSVLPKGSLYTKVYVRKDNEEPVLINRTFGEPSEIPSELYINKKFKKYKRLQFIVKNESEEDFGLDMILKNYTIGNYAKK